MTLSTGTSALQLRFLSRGSVLWSARPQAQLAVCFPAQVAHQAFGLAMAGTLEKAQIPQKKHVPPPCDILYLFFAIICPKFVPLQCFNFSSPPRISRNGCHMQEGQTPKGRTWSWALELLDELRDSGADEETYSSAICAAMEAESNSSDILIEYTSIYIYICIYRHIHTHI